MRKLLIILALITIATACSKHEDPVFDKTTDERLTEKLAYYQDLLTSQQDGWYLVINTKRAGGFKFWVSFEADNRVRVLSDMDATYTNVGETSTEIQENGYRMKALMSPSLIFDTYSYVHVLADPNPKIIDGDRAEGLESDFEFSLLEVEEDGTINLKGNYNGCTAMLVPVGSQDVEEVKAGKLKDEILAINNYSASSKFTSVKIEGTTVSVVLNSRNVGFSYYADEDFVSINTSAYIVSNSASDALGQILFFEPVSIFDKNYVSIDWSDDAYNLVAEDGSKFTLFDNKRPPYALDLGYDKTFTKFYANIDQLEGSNSEVYLSEFYNVANNRMIEERGGRSLEDISAEFELNSITSEPEMNLKVRYKNKAGKLYSTTWIYTYEMGKNNMITFTNRRQAGNKNEFNYERSLQEIPDFFCELEYENYDSSSKPDSWEDVIVTKVIPKTFKIDWLENNTEGSSAILGGFISVDNEALFLAGEVSN